MSAALVTLREAVPEDAPVLAALVREAFEEYRGRLDPPSSAHDKSVETVTRELKDGGAFLASTGSQSLGCVFFHPRVDHVYLDRLAVLPPFRGRGVARLLIEAVETRARQLGHTRVRLSVRLALEDHHVYYGRLGYQHHGYGTHEGYATPTFVILEKTLGA